MLEDMNIKDIQAIKLEASDPAMVIMLREAFANHPLAQGWYGIQGGGTKKVVRCYVCDATIDTYAAKWPEPKHVKHAVQAHLAEHLAEVIANQG